MKTTLSAIYTSARELRRLKGMTQKQLVSKMKELLTTACEGDAYFGADGVGDSALSKFEKGTMNMTDLNMHLLAAALGTDLTSLSAHRTENVVREIVPQNAAVVRNYTIKQVPFVPVRARATFAENYSDTMLYSNYESFPLVTQPGEEEYKTPLIVEIDGDSMEPILRPGWRVLVTPENQADWEYMRPGIIAIVYRNYFVVKRVMRNTLGENGLLQLESDNPSGGVASVRMDDIRAIWRVRRIVDAPIDLG